MLKRLALACLLLLPFTSIIGCGDNYTPSGPTSPMPPSQEVKTRNGKSVMVKDEVPMAPKK